MEKRIIYKRPGKEPEIMEVSAKYRCDIKHLIANADIVEHAPLIPMRDGTVLMVLIDEDGHPKGLPFNLYLPMNNRYFPIQMMVGDVIITKFKPDTIFEDDYDFQIESLTSSDIRWALTFFKDNVQLKLQKKFKEMFPTKSSYLEPKVVSFDW